MKKVKLLSAIFIALLTLSFVACEKDEDTADKPEIKFDDSGEFISSDATAAAGEVIQVKVIASWNGTHSLKTLKVTVEEQEVKTYTIPEEGKELTNLTMNITKSTAATEEWVFEVTDEAGGKASVSLVLTKDETGGEISSYTDVELGAQSNTSLGSFYNPVDNSIYKLTDAGTNAADVDMLAYYDASDKMVVASPGANLSGIFDLSSWSVNNETRYLKIDMTANQFSYIDSDKLMETAYASGDAKRKAKELTADDVYVFKTEAGKYGLFLVKNAGTSATGTVTFDVKIQK